MTTNITAKKQAEQYVQECWLSKTIVEQQADEFGKLSLWKMNDTLYATEADAWFAAAEYTRAHEQKITEKREEVKAISEWIAYIDRYNIKEPAAQRILAVLEAQLTDLLWGWRKK